MAGIVFYFEDNERDVWSGRRVDLDAWNYATKVAGDIERAIIINKSREPVQPFDRNIDTQIVDVRPELQGRVVELVCPWRSKPDTLRLWDFDHAVDWYVFGPAAGHDATGLSVCVPQAGIGAMHAVHVASVVMAHRYSVIGE